MSLRLLYTRRTGDRRDGCLQTKTQSDRIEVLRLEFIYQGKRFQGSTRVSTKTAAKEVERQRKAELERAH